MKISEKSIYRRAKELQHLVTIIIIINNNNNNNNKLIYNFQSSSSLLIRVLNHPHIVKFYGILLDKGTSKTALVMEKCKGNLKSHIFSGPESVPGKSENPAVFRDVRRYAKEITDGLAFMHAKEVAHRDLKLENILVPIV